MKADPQMILTLNKNRFLENLNFLQIGAIFVCSSTYRAQTRILSNFFLNNTFISNKVDGKAKHIIFTSEALYREIDNLKDNKAINAVLFGVM